LVAALPIVVRAVKVADEFRSSSTASRKHWLLGVYYRSSPGY